MATKKERTGRARGLRGKLKEAAAEVAGRLDTAKLKTALDDLRSSRDAAAARGNETASAAVSGRAVDRTGRDSEGESTDDDRKEGHHQP